MQYIHSGNPLFRSSKSKGKRSRAHVKVQSARERLGYGGTASKVSDGADASPERDATFRVVLDIDQSTAANYGSRDKLEKLMASFTDRTLARLRSTFPARWDQLRPLIDATAYPDDSGRIQIILLVCFHPDTRQYAEQLLQPALDSVNGKDGLVAQYLPLADGESISQVRKALNSHVNLLTGRPGSKRFSTSHH